MGLTQVQSVPFVYNRPRLFVQVRRNWWDEWTSIPYLWPIQYTMAVAPEMPTALLCWNAGDISRGDGPGAGEFRDYDFFPDRHDPTLAWLHGVMDRCFVRILRMIPPSPSSQGGVVQDWVGVIVSDARELLGQYDASPEVPVGLQTITAFGLEHLLNEYQIDRAYHETRTLDADFKSVVPGSDTEEPVGFIGWAPDFNCTLGSGGFRGNRTGVALQGGRYKIGWVVHAFSGYQCMAWRYGDIVRYLLEFFQPMGDEEGALKFTVSDLKNYDLLYPTGRIVRQEGKTVWELLTELADEALGLGWHVVCDDARPGVPVEIRFFSRFANDVLPPVKGAVPILSNPDRISISTQDRALAAPVVETDYTRKYDAFVVNGERAVACCSLSNADGTLHRAWNDAQQSAYLYACAGSPTYPPATDVPERARVNDEFREDPINDAVFARFRLPHDWDWLVGTGTGSAIFTRLFKGVSWTDGTLKASDQTYVQWRHRRPFLRWLPLLDGWDYSVDPPTHAGNSEDQLRQPFAVIWDEGIPTPRWRYTSMGVEDIGGAHLRMGDDDDWLEVRFSPKHLLARNDWAGAEPSDTDTLGPMDKVGMDWRKLIVSVALQSDVRLTVLGFGPGSEEVPNANDLYLMHRLRAKTLRINVPDAHLWYATYGTVVGIDPQGGLKQAPLGGLLLRSDADLLKLVLAVAMEWYGTERRSIVLTRNDLSIPVRPGQIIEKLDAGTEYETAVNTVVTRVSVNNTGGGSVTIHTGRANLEPVHVARNLSVRFATRTYHGRKPTRGRGGRRY